jgi:orotate phosphoribosyltransferase
MSAVAQSPLIQLLSVRNGHFRLESGHHGDTWLELEKLFARPTRLRCFVDELAKRISGHDGEAVCGPLSGGAFLAQMIAERLDLEFYHSAPVACRQDSALYSVQYEIPAAVRSHLAGKRLVIVDDVINAGSAVRATFAALRNYGARPVSIAALLVLGDAASAFVAEKQLSLERVASLPNRIWAPSECPLCAAGLPVENLRML